jgi:hypothetical protein
MHAILHSMAGRLRGRYSDFVSRSKHRIYWNLTRNPDSRRRFASSPPTLSDIQQKVCRDLAHVGIAFISVMSIGLDPDAMAQLATDVEDFVTSDRVKQKIEQFKQDIGHRRMGGDDYMVKRHPEGPTFPLSHPLIQLALCGPMLDIVNSYIGLWTKLIYTDVWHTIPADPGTRIGSQNWHRDPEDRQVVKVYLYFNDVDATAGPMEYVPNSAPGQRYGRVYRWKPHAREHRYPPEAEFNRRFAGAERMLCTGSPGTLIFCDTDGFHRGGIATARPRILATWTFVTPASIGITSRRRFTISPTIGYQDLSPAARFALS